MKEECVKYLMEQLGDEAYVKDVYEEYVKSLKEKLVEVKIHFGTKNWKNLDMAAHAVKGNALSVNDLEMVETAIELRRVAVLENEEKTEAQIRKFEELIEDR